ncbi:MAG: DUF721 domain-containing protein [Deltaproteobacteria bacterium]|nr:DUF721 domain-containing protein [Deltaproteobacteria bacterium]
MKRRVRRRKTKNATPTTVGAVLSRFLRRKQLDVDLLPHRIRQAWSSIVGPRVASRTCPRELSDGTLVVNVESSAWLNELTFLRYQIINRINAVLGSNVVSALRLVVGSITPAISAARHVRYARPAMEVVEISDEALADIDRDVSQVESAELQSAIRRARIAAQSRRATGNRDPHSRH